MAQKKKLSKTALISLYIILIIYFGSIIAQLIGLVIESNINNEKLIENVQAKEKILNNISNYIFEARTYKVYVDELPYGTEDKYESVVNESINFWENIENVKFERTYTKDEADIYVSWIKDFGSGYVGLTHTTSNYVQIGLGDSNCGTWLPYTYNYVLKIAEHEFGHVLGYEHSDNPNSLMYPTLMQEYEYIIDKEEVLPSGYYQFFSVCSGNDIADFSIEVKSDEPLNIYVIPSYDDFDKIINNKEFNHYEDCQENETKHYDKQCAITNTSGIVIGNTYSYNAATYKIKVEER